MVLEKMHVKNFRLLKDFEIYCRACRAGCAGGRHSAQGGCGQVARASSAVRVGTRRIHSSSGAQGFGCACGG